MSKRATSRAAPPTRQPQRRGAPSGVTKPPSGAGHDRRPLGQQLLRVGPQNPAGVSSIMRLADTGYMWRLCDLFEEFRNLDCHTQTVTSRRERSLANVPWQLIAASEKRRDLKVAAWVEEVLKAMGSAAMRGIPLRGFSDAVIHLNGGVIHGYSAGELPWMRDGKYVKPAGFLPMGPRRFIYATMDGSLRWYDVNGPLHDYPGIDLLGDFPDGRFMVHRPRINGAAGPREGLIRPLTWATMFRNWAVADWHRMGEQAWKPYRVGYYKKDGSVDEDRTALEEAARELTAMGFTALPDSVTLEIAYAKNRTAGDGGVHGALASFLAAEMSKVTLGATLAVEQGRVGSNALGNVHESVATQVRDADARAMEETIQRQLIAPLVRYNFGDVPVPVFRFITEEGADLSLLAIAIEKLAKQGLQIPAKWTRTSFGIPEPEVGEELLDGTLRRDPEEVAAEAEKAREEQAQQQQAAPNAEQPAKGQLKPSKKAPAAANDSGEGDDLPVSEKALQQAHRAYVVDRILTMAGMRRPLNYGRPPANDSRVYAA